MSALLLLALSAPATAADPGTASFGGKGFTVADAAGANTLNLGLSFQPRFSATLAGDPDAADVDALDDVGFRVRRMLLTAGGTLAGRLDYRFRIDAAKAFTFTDGAGSSQQAARAILDDAQVTFRIAEPLTLSVGQYKVPFTAQQMMSDTTLLAADRALVIDGLRYGDTRVSGWSWSRDLGAHVGGSVADKKLEYQVGVFNGDGANTWPPTDRGFLYTARAQVAPLGAFPYDEIDFERGKPRLAIGGGASLNTHPAFTEEGDADGSANDLRTGGELRFAASGLSVNGEVLYGRVSPADGSDATSSLGFYGQVGYYLPVGVAPGVRFSQVDPDLDGEDDTVQQIDGVVNWYLPDFASDKPGKNLGHKAQVQLVWTTALQEGLDHPLYHQITLASAVGF